MNYDQWRETCDTLHAHTQVLGKLAVALAPAEPQLQHAALRLTPRGWETAPLPAPDGSGTFGVALDLRSHEAIVEASNGGVGRVSLVPDRPVGTVTKELLATVHRLVGPVEINMTPQEVPWTVGLDADEEHARYDPDQVATYFVAATQAALALAAFRAPYRGRSTPVNAWWGSFDLAVSLFSGRTAVPPAHDFITRNAMDAQEIAIGWWPGDRRYPELPSTSTPTRPLRNCPPSPWLRTRPTGIRPSANSSSIGATSAPARIRRPPPASSSIPPSTTPARCASGSPALSASADGVPPPVV